MKKTELAILLSRLEGFEEPNEALEQYSTPADIVADILYHACLQGNIAGKTVADLGCGTGIIALGCALLGAKKVFGVELDRRALEAAKRNEQKLREEGYEVSVEWACMNVSDFSIQVDAVVQNPPFGLKQEKQDRIFIRKAIEAAPVVYSIHHSSEGTRNFINGFAQNLGACVASVKHYSLGIPKVFYHHRSRTHWIGVDCYLITRGVGHESKGNQV